ncbi:MAG TPA: gluconate 2-dehydrogenase subunit 3 family protein [Candidatus Dormibacteraeota bacterium]|nr:gluconate 2-dehydrogenase subunit 3 family protein [Candidatus Dormibacteraeota bacterium]
MTGALMFLNSKQAATIDAVASRIVPGDASDPGAQQAEAVIYIDRALAGFMRELQTFYRTGIQELDSYSIEHAGRAFVELKAEQQDEIIGDLDRLAISDKSDLLGQFFEVVREHVVQGLFCDPAYGGNRGGVGWRLVGFPGAQWGYTAEQMQRNFDATTIPLTTLDDLYSKRTP